RPRGEHVTHRGRGASPAGEALEFGVQDGLVTVGVLGGAHVEEATATAAGLVSTWGLIRLHAGRGQMAVPGAGAGGRTRGVGIRRRRSRSPRHPLPRLLGPPASAPAPARCDNIRSWSCTPATAPGRAGVHGEERIPAGRACAGADAGWVDAG